MSSIRKTAGGESSMTDGQRGLFEGLIEALADKHSQVDLNFQNVSLRLPGVQRMAVELNGTVTLSVHMRELSDQEKEALVSRNVASVASRQTPHN
jgi:hypothetical protein